MKNSIVAGIYSVIYICFGYMSLPILLEHGMSSSVITQHFRDLVMLRWWVTLLMVAVLISAFIFIFFLKRTTSTLVLLGFILIIGLCFLFAFMYGYQKICINDVLMVGGGVKLTEIPVLRIYLLSFISSFFVVGVADYVITGMRSN